MESRVDQDFLELWEALEILIVQSTDLCLSLLQAGAWLQASNVIPVVAVMDGLLFGGESEWHPQAHVRVNEIEIAGHDANDCEGPAADAQFTAKDRFFSAVQLLPKTLTEDHLLIAADFALFF